MSHEISALVGPAANLRRLVWPSWVNTLYASPWCPGGPALLPLLSEEEEDAGFVAWRGSMAGEGGPDGAWMIDPPLALRAREASVGAAVAYLEMNYQGSCGYELAAAWVDGAEVYGPETLWVPPGSPPSPAPRTQGLLRGLRDRLLMRPVPAAVPPPRKASPISEALARLGVALSGDEDAFTAYGLGSVRNNGDFARTWTALPPTLPAG